MTDNPYLVSTDWVLRNLKDPKIRIIECSEDESLYDEWHIPNAQKISWRNELRSKEQRDYISKEQFEELMSRLGIDNDTTVILYGDKGNWFACNAFWVFKYYGHKDVRIMDGGRIKWEAESKPKSWEVPSFNRTFYRASFRDERIRAYIWEIKKALAEKREDIILVDIRSPKEYAGEVISTVIEEYAFLGGHIPGAVNIPWTENLNKDWTFKSKEELEKLYKSRGVTPDKEVIVYCRVGERSAINWFVLKCILNYPRVKNYDGSWTEWGNSVKAPVKKGYEP